jgi:hypothetical protein
MSDTNGPTEKPEELIVASREAREMSVTDGPRGRSTSSRSRRGALRPIFAPPPGPIARTRPADACPSRLTNLALLLRAKDPASRQPF